MKTNRQKVFDKYGGKCSYCGCDLVKGWHVDHFEPIVRDWVNGGCERPENNNEANYMPSCASCNIMKSSLSLESSRALVSGFVNSLNLYSTQYKITKRYGLVTEIDKPIVFYFETYRVIG